MTKSPEIAPDECALGMGSITGAAFNINIKSRTWSDASGKVVGNGVNLTGMRAGTYTLRVRSEHCEENYSFTIAETSNPSSAPFAPDLRVCGPSEVLFRLTEPISGLPSTGTVIYRIYTPEGILLKAQDNPAFRVRIDLPGTYYASISHGNCESPLTRFNISFGSPGLTIPNVFSPNNDGRNDTWNIQGLDAYIRPEVRVYNRFGNTVYRAVGQSAPFDGTNKGRDLPAGVYYYLIKASNDCPLQTGSLMLIR